MIVETAAGRVELHERDGVLEGLGIPYASAGRWEAPSAPEPWTGVRAADAVGPICPQPPGDYFMSVDLPQGDACLSANVWTPSTTGARPVMVWIHGGGFRTGGAAHQLCHPGAALAARGDVVVVSINYRLGALGFLAHPDLDRGDGVTANWGFLDQRAALRWVQQNAAAFGGDPNNVTIFGESAGAACVGIHMTSSVDDAPFHRAVLQSGVALVDPMDRAIERAERLARHAGVESVRDLAAAEVGAIIDAQQVVEKEDRTLMAFAPVVDGCAVLGTAGERVRQGMFADVPVILGTNAEEVRLGGAARALKSEVTDEVLRRRLARSLGERTDDIVTAYAKARADRGEPTTPADLWFSIETDRFFRAPLLRFADALVDAGADVRAYLFEWKSPALDGWMGACHTLEIPFVFGHQGRSDLAWLTGEGEAADRLAATMMGAWAAHARTGAASAGDLAWPSYDTAARPTVVFDAATTVCDDPRPEWRALL